MAHNDSRTLAKLNEIDRRGRGLTTWEVDFVADLVDDNVTRFSDRQAETVDRIHRERVLGEKRDRDGGL